MARVPVSTRVHRNDFGQPVRTEEGLAEKMGLVAHGLRQALQDLGVEIDADDYVETDDFDTKKLRDAYLGFAKAEER